MYTLVVLLAGFLGIQAIFNETLVQEQWEEFKQKHGKIYKSEFEEKYRMGVFMVNLDKIEKHNQLYVQGLSTYKMGINKFADLTKEEFLSRFIKIMPLIGNSSVSVPWSVSKDSLPRSMQDSFIFAPRISLPDVPDLPKEIDWRSHGVVTPVKDQGHCESCWSFSATGALEAQWRLNRSSQLISLSEQNLVDCSSENHGCSGGFPHLAFQYIIENGGIDSENTYPYTGKDGQCKYNPKNKAATVSKVVLVPEGEDQLKIKVGTIGPMSVAINANDKFQAYTGGILHDPECGHDKNDLNHAVLVVGYGTSNGEDYWLVKNSWGFGFGEQGYIRMSRNKNNQCGIALMVSYPEV